MVSVLELAGGLLDALKHEAAAAHPLECCGILLGEGDRIIGLLPAANVHPRPESHFEIDPQALVDAHRAARQGGPKVAGYYHSHPNGRAEPSTTDRAQSARDGSVWAIVAAGEVTFWRDAREGFLPLSYTAPDS
jgi:proteasome lid subunit RPN8/RPN11